jgi:hypothetical protein
MKASLSKRPLRNQPGLFLEAGIRNAEDFRDPKNLCHL